MAITTTSSLPAPVQQHFSDMLLAVAVPNMIYNIPAMYKRMPRSGGTTLRMRRYNPLATALVPLGNTGQHPPAQVPTAVDIDAVISFYGTYVIINEQLVLQNQDPVLNEVTARLGVSLRQTEDELTRDALRSTSTFINSVNGTNGDIPTELSGPDIDIMIRLLVGADAYTFMSGIEGEDRFGTAPVRSSYFVLSHSDIIPDLEAVPGFISKWNYPNQMDTLDSEWGSVGNSRFLVTSNGSTSFFPSNNGNLVYHNFFVGRESYACIKQDGYSSQFIYRSPIHDGPLALNVSVGYKFAQVPRITNDTWVLNLRSTLSS